MKGILFLFWFLYSFFPVVLALEKTTPTTDWHNSSPDNAHQKESLSHGWFKYPSSHLGRKFHYGHSFTPPPPPAEPLLVRPYASFYLLTYLVGYYLLGWFSSMMSRFANLGHLGHLAMITVPIGSVIAGLNLGALVHQVGKFFPIKWVPDTGVEPMQHRVLSVPFWALTRDPVSPANESTGLSNNPKITRVTTERKMKKLSLEFGLP
ncbi:hypothetical protein DSO57_1034218 [Entomophthora muscae]|uniref:Uncharacterized protein n=1 Tax=Entomophthora muscae TaxID=34485 RepID=A0ACC2TY81_9FUNG|nr:hypothetical protein DSO57_1034218 [Entomophthora muscae]